MAEVKIDSLFSLSNEMAAYVGSSEEGFKNFLLTAAFTLHNTVSNQLLIQSYLMSINGRLPAAEVKTADEWHAEGISVRNDMPPIYIMEIGGDEKGYHPKAVYDISQTDAGLPSSNDKGIVLEQFMKSAPCRITYTDNFKIKGTKAMYMPAEDTISVTKGFKSFDEIFSSLAMEYMHRSYARGGDDKENTENKGSSMYQRGVYNDSAYAGAYMIAARYGFDTSSYSFASTIERLKGADYKDIKKVLENIVSPAINYCKAVDRNMDAYLEAGDINAART
ncbi:MAG: hypothetical protein NC428_07660 [Clostridium sp.]|nr:hypothetical protein [Clostridium sp.]